MKNKHPGSSQGIFICDQCQYRTVNKQNYEHHLEDHKNGLVNQMGMSTEGKDHRGLGKKKNVTSNFSTKTKPNTLTVQPLGQINTIDLSKVPGLESMAPGDLNAAQLIYSALNAMSQQPSAEQPLTNHTVSGASVETGQTPQITSITHDGVTTHTITLHLPQSSGAHADVSIPQEGTSSASIDVTNPVIMALNNTTQQGIGSVNTVESAAAAGEIQYSTEASQQMTDIVQQAAQGLEVLQQSDTNNTQIVQAVPHGQLMQGFEIVQPQVIQTLGSLQSVDGVHYIQSAVSMDGQPLPVQGQNIITAENGHILLKSMEEVDSKNIALGTEHAEPKH